MPAKKPATSVIKETIETAAAGKIGARSEARASQYGRSKECQGYSVRGGMWRCGGICRRTKWLRVGSWDEDGEVGAFSGFGVDVDSAGVFFDEAASGWEAEARAAGLGGEVWGEDFVELVGRDAAGPVSMTWMAQAPQLQAGGRPQLEAIRGGRPEPAPVEESRPERQASAEPAHKLKNLHDCAVLASEKRDIPMKMAIQRQMRLVKFEPGKIEIQPTEDAPADIAGEFGRKLTEWTGQRWFVVVSRTQGRPTIHEEEEANQQQLLSDAKSHPTVAALLSAFPGARVVDVKVQASEEDEAALADPMVSDPLLSEALGDDEDD